MTNRDDIVPFGSDRLHEAVLDGMGDGVIATDSDGKIVFLNLVAQRFTQCSDDAARGRSIEDVMRLLDEKTRESLPCGITVSLQRGFAGQVTPGMLLVGKDSLETPISERVSPIRDDNGRVVGAVTVLRSLDQGREVEHRFHDLIEQVSDHAIFMTDADGIITSWNRGVKDLVGYAEGEFIGYHIGELIFTDEAVAEGVPDWEFETARDKGSAIDDRWMKRKDGSHFWASGIMTVLRDGNEAVVGYNKIMRDLTEQKTNLDAIRKLNFELSQSQKHKDNFISTLAHELRNPLAPVTAALTLMEDCLDDSQQVAELQKIASTQVGQLVGLVEDLLDVSRIGQGRLELTRTTCELQPIVQQAVESCEAFMKDSSQILTVQMPSKAISVSADSRRMVQVVTNVLNNAAKYTTEGGQITLSVSSNEGRAKIEVTDNGVGISEEDLKVVFDLFAQANASSERGNKGLGIGLALVKRIMDLHGGKLLITSDGLDRGTTVTIELAVADGEESELVEPASTPDDTRATCVLDVLVVDDTPAITFTLGRLVEKIGHRVRTTESGENALEMIEAQRPDVIISDISMPGMSGYELAAEIRSQFGDTILLVAMTGFSNLAARDRALEAGFDRHMVKPPDVRELRLMFESFQDSHSRVAEQQRPGKSKPAE